VTAVAALEAAQTAMELQAVSVRYPGSPPVEALRSVDLRISPGELAAIMGPSGSGKSTLLHIMGTLERPTRGRVWVAGQEVAGLADGQLSGFRARHIGFVFQQFYLLDGLTALENVAGGLLYRGVPAGRRRQLATIALRRVGLGRRLNHRPSQLSGGEQQRVAIARAVVGRPSIVLADEPTGNLDTRAGQEVMEILFELSRDGTTVVLITHNAELAARFPRQIELRDGTILRDSVEAPA
jgi:putative ABC transport system ATP-binding protein